MGNYCSRDSDEEVSVKDYSQYQPPSESYKNPIFIDNKSPEEINIIGYQ